MIDQSWEGYSTEWKTMTLTSEWIQQFTEGIKDTHHLYTQPETAQRHGYDDVLAPPTLPALFWQEFSTPWLPTDETVIHGEQEFIYHTPLTAGKKITCSIEVTSVKQIDTSTNVFQLVKQTLRGVEEGSQAPLFDAIMTILLPMEQKKVSSKRDQGQEKKQRGQTLDAASFITPPFHTDWIKQYAHLSGDEQAIHIDEDAAKKAGFKRNIVHGLFMMAVGARAFHPEMDKGYYINHYRMRFTAPLLSGETLHIRRDIDTNSNQPLINIAGYNDSGEHIFTGRMTGTYGT